MTTPLNRGLARVRTEDGPVVVLHRAGDPTGRVALVGSESFDDLPRLLEAAGGDIGAVTEGPEVPVAEEDVLAPVGRPRKIICVGQNYIDHVKEGGRDAGPAHPDLFAKWDNALAGPYETLPLPPESDQVDYESELTVVIGKRCRRVPEADVAGVVFGYTAANDGSVRDWQFHTAQRTAGKGWDRLTPVGPLVVPAGVLGGAEPDVVIQGLLNDEVVQDDRTSSLLFDVPALIAYISTLMTLEPGDLVLTGTPSGVGFVRKPPRLLVDGDTFEVRIEGIGSLRNRFVAEQPT